MQILETTCSQKLLYYIHVYILRSFYIYHDIKAMQRFFTDHICICKMQIRFFCRYCKPIYIGIHYDWTDTLFSCFRQGGFFGLFLYTNSERSPHINSELELLLGKGYVANMCLLAFWWLFWPFWAFLKTLNLTFQGHKVRKIVSMPAFIIYSQITV